MDTQQHPSLFGLDISIEAAQLLVLPIPWEGTVSFRTGTSRAPQQVIELSHQIDHYDPRIANAWTLGVAALPLPRFVQELNQRALRIRSAEDQQRKIAFLNQASLELLRWIEQTATYWLDRGKLIALLGGEHSITPGLIAALHKRHPRFSILHFDAHADLRQSYEELTYSHATAMYHALRYEAVDRLISVGIRDLSNEEMQYVQRNADRVQLFHSWDLHTQLFSGTPWDTLCDTIIDKLSDHVYISFDIDVLNPGDCPHTGTPVPGGLSFMQVLYLIHKVYQSGRRIIGFDLVEVGYHPHNNLDAIIAAHLLYQLANIAIASNMPLDNHQVQVPQP